MTKLAEVFPPGEFLKDELEARNWSQVEFAEIIGRPARLINEIIAGKRAITPETAIQLGASLGTSAELWMNLETQWQLSRVAPAANEVIQKKAQLHQKYPVREMVRRGWIKATKTVEDLESELLKFFRIDSLDEAPVFAHAAKKTSYEEDISPIQTAWLYRVKQVAESQVAKKYDAKALQGALPSLQALLSAPEEVRHVPRILGDVGVRFLIVEALPASKIDGVCFWLRNSQPVVAMSTRLDRIDNFWFVLRHELEHVLKEHRKDENPVVDEGLDEDGSPEQEEREANAAAQEFAVLNSELNDYMRRVNPYFFSEERVLGFAGRLRVHPGIVVGRLQRALSKSQPESYKFLRRYLVKVRQFVTQAAPTDGWGNVYPG